MGKFPRRDRADHNIELVGMVYDPVNNRRRRELAAGAVCGTLIAIAAAKFVSTLMGGNSAVPHESRMHQRRDSAGSSEVYFNPVIGGVVVGDEFSFETTVNGRDTVFTFYNGQNGEKNNVRRLPWGKYSFISWLGDRKEPRIVREFNRTIGPNTHELNIPLPQHRGPDTQTVRPEAGSFQTADNLISYRLITLG